jgi:hypothetical protein
MRPPREPPLRGPLTMAFSSVAVPHLAIPLCSAPRIHFVAPTVRPVYSVVAAPAVSLHAHLATPVAALSRVSLLLLCPPHSTMLTAAASTRRSIGPWRRSPLALLPSTAMAPRCRWQRMPHQDMIHVASAHFKCFRGTLHLFHTYVAKLDRHVTYVASVCPQCFIRFIDVCCKCVYLDVAYFTHVL